MFMFRGFARMAGTSWTTFANLPSQLMYREYTALRSVGVCRGIGFPSAPGENGTASAYPISRGWQDAQLRLSSPDRRVSSKSCRPNSIFAGVLGFSASSGGAGSSPSPPGSGLIASMGYLAGRLEVAAKASFDENKAAASAARMIVRERMAPISS